MEKINEYYSTERRNSLHDNKIEITHRNLKHVYQSNEDTITSSVVARAVSQGTKIPIKNGNLRHASIKTDKDQVVNDKNSIHPETKKAKPVLLQKDYYFKAKKAIKLKGLQLQSIPTELFHLDTLESLTLSPERESCLDYKLPFLPKEIGKLCNLQTLVLDTNELEQLPDEIGNLEQLEVLLLSNNLLTVLPTSFQDLSSLKSLHLANNKFLELPKLVCNLTNLSFLDMTDNEIEFIPDEISNLTSLHTLLLLMNNIENLPESITTLTSLTLLWLGENRLVSLPASFGELFRLDWGLNPCSSNIDGNPLVNPPLEICQHGPMEIRRYFHEKEKGKKQS